MKGNSVIKRISLLIAAAFMALTLAAPAALAAPPAAEACPEGSTYNFEKGKASCTTVTEEDVNPSGKDNNGNKPHTETEITVEEQKGQGGGGGEQTNRHHDEDSSCEVTNGGGNAPGGQNPC